MRTPAAPLLFVLILLASGCGGSEAGSDGDKMVWCVAPGEVVDADFKREYPELYMSEEACEAFR
jgi:hypothetical protein